jgi:hypothetical protein
MSQPATSPAQQLAQLARQAMGQGNRTEARRLAMEAARLDPQLEDALSLIHISEPTRPY